MNDANLEHMLRSMKPIAPSADLAERVRHDLALADMFRSAAEDTEPLPAAHRKPLTWATSAFWAGIGAAAAVVVMLALSQEGGFGTRGGITSTPSKINASSIMPVSTTREWVDVEDQGIRFTTPDNPERQVRVRSVERQRWIDPVSGAEYIIEVPQVESVALPVKFQ